ncbi:MAG: 2-oxoglutarate dehydrogenase complex dihydrolipoyllysine-residue succinyltransferase [Trueperaceae bacterium]|nr:2-oxoglutarate dehydrogenase complex dihydrolipoyllysine-residue succinyltransferase [Trueperaceae bacterium]
MPVEVTVPSVGESISEVFIGTWLKQEGDEVAKDEALVEIETDKATLEISAPVAGVLGKVVKQAGDTANVGEVIAHVESNGGTGKSSETDTGSEPATTDSSASSTPAEDDAAAPDPETAEDAPTAAAEPASGTEPTSADGEARVMPAAQRLLDEHGVAPADVEASGPGGRILKEDVQRYLDAATDRAAAGGAQATSAQATTRSASDATEPSTPAPGAAAHRQEESVAMSPLRRKIAERLVHAQQTAALLTTFNEADMSAVMALRGEYRDNFEKRYGVRLGFMSFFVKAVIDGLKQIPQLNAEIRERDIVYKNYYDIGVAVSTPKGLVVPVLRNAELLSFAEVEKAVGDFGARARENKLTPEDLQGGTFTITNGGIFGSLMSTPIVNPPQSGVLGMHAIQERPVAIEGRVEVRPMMYLALTYDHRIVDGREAVTFLKRVKDAIEKPARMLIEV